MFGKMEVDLESNIYNFFLGNMVEVHPVLPWSHRVVVLVCFRVLWKEWGNSNFQNFSQNSQFHHRRLEPIEHIKKEYIILSTTVSFLDIKDAILFLQCLSFFMCTFPLFLQVRFVFNVI